MLLVTEIRRRHPAANSRVDAAMIRGRMPLLRVVSISSLHGAGPSLHRRFQLRTRQGLVGIKPHVQLLALNAAALIFRYTQLRNNRTKTVGDRFCDRPEQQVNFRLRTGLHRLRCLIPILFLAVVSPVFGQDEVVVAIVNDGPTDRLELQQQTYIDELLALTGTEFNVEIRRFSGDWSKASIDAALDSAYADTDVDMVLAVGFVANQISATKQEFSKPTFLPLILDVALLSNEPTDEKSGVQNLSYLNTYANFAGDLDTFLRILPIQHLALMVDQELAAAIPELSATATSLSEERGIELVIVPHDGIDHRLVNYIPADTDALFIAGLPRMPPSDFAALVDNINVAGLPSYSFLGVSDVEKGLLVTNAEPRDLARLARLNALNMQAVMLGGKAEDQSTAAQNKERLTINMETARKIGLSINFDVMNSAVLLNQDTQLAGQELGLVDIAQEALDRNQDLQAETFGVQAGLEEIARARSNLLPQVGASASYTLRNESLGVSAGLLSETSTDTAVSVDQILYSDAAVANLQIQKDLQRTRLASLDEFRLDVVEAATVSYYRVLNARSQLAVQVNNLRITRSNLELAVDRVRLGTSSQSDVFRWEAEEARAQILVLNSRAAMNQAWENLNRILHRPQGGQLALREATFDEPFVMKRAEFDALIRSPADYNKFSSFYISRALSQAPEIAQLDSQIEAKQREALSQRRAYWLPDFSIGGRYNSNLNQSGIGAGELAGEGLNDWNVGIQATLPIFSGGLKKANLSRSNYELRQLQSFRESTIERVEEEIRIQLYATRASYAQIDLRKAAAEASSKSLALVSDAYASGTVTVVELLDAQETSLTASAAEADSLYSFLITIMQLQRAVGGFDYLLPTNERTALAARFRAYMTGTK
jgi:outer membrane protein